MDLKVEYTEHGLVRPTFGLDCLGAKCPHLRNGGCRVDTHHFYFESDVYNAIGGIFKAFKDHDFNKKKMARCRHELLHRENAKGVIVPEPETIHAFLFEVDILQDLGVLAKSVAFIDGLFASENPKAKYEAGHRIEQYLEHRADHVECYSSLLQKITQLEVVPDEVAAHYLSRLPDPVTLGVVPMNALLLAA